MDDLKDILLDGEEVIWSGRPDPSVVKPLAPYWRRKVVHALWLLFALAVVAACFRLKVIFSEFSLLFNTIFVIGIVGLIPGVATFLDFKDAAVELRRQHYVLTNFRLIAFLQDGIESKQILKNAAFAIWLNKKHQPHRLCIFYGGQEAEFLSLIGLRDIDEAEKLIVETLAPRSAE